MKKIFICICVVALSFLHVKYSYSDEITRGIPIEEFSGIVLKGSADLHLKKSAINSIEIIAEKEIIEKISVYEKSDFLNIDFKYKDLSKKKPRININVQDVSLISLYGNCNLIFENEYRSKNLKIESNGSLIAELNLDIDKLTFISTGSSDIKIRGKSAEAKIELKGSSRFDSKEFVTKKTDCVADGNYLIYINCEEFLNANLSGNGILFYSGNPKLSSKKSGSVQIRPIELNQNKD